MARSKKLEKNLGKVQDMLDGNYNEKIQVGYTNTPEPTRKVGDTWEDSDGNKWEQKEGFKVKVSSLPARGVADECGECNSYIIKPWDKDSYKHNGRCYYCQIDFESKYSRHVGGTPQSYTELDDHQKYQFGRFETYIEGWKKEEKIWKKELEEEKVFDKSVANALANHNIDTTNVKLKNNTK